MAESNNGRFYTVAEAAKMLAVSPSTVWRWIEAERLPAYRVGSRAIRIKKEDLEAMVQPARSHPRGKAVDNERYVPKPLSEKELERRQALVAEILALREKCDIRPLTTADLVHMVREEEYKSYGKPARRPRR